MVSVWPYLLESALGCLESMVSCPWGELLATITILYRSCCTIQQSVKIIMTGAGKTTTFSILTGDSSMTSGTAIIAGYDIRTHLRKVSALQLHIVSVQYILLHHVSL